MFLRYMSIKIVFFCFLCICQSKWPLFVKLCSRYICLSSLVKMHFLCICLSLLPTYIEPLPPVAGFGCYPLPKFVLLKHLFMGFFWFFLFQIYFYLYLLFWYYIYKLTFVVYFYNLYSRAPFGFCFWYVLSYIFISNI